MCSVILQESKFLIPLLMSFVPVYLRKLSDEEQPLRLRLLAGPSEKALSFVLKENETGEVNVSLEVDFGCLRCIK